MRLGGSLAPRRRLALLASIFLLCVCSAGPAIATSSVAAVAGADQQEGPKMWMTVGGHRFAITMADTEAARAFVSRLPLSIDMADLNANEKHAELSQALPAKASRPGSIRAGDVMLYGSKTLVVFYESLDSSYSYTRLGHVVEPAGLANALGKGSARLHFSKD
jgi:hypothetical protein